MLGERISPYMLYAQGLIIGTEKAALIDTGMGISAHIQEAVSARTKLPVLCLLTHCDPDHAGAASLFAPIYMSPLDHDQIQGRLTASVRLADISHFIKDDRKLLCYAKKNMLPLDTFSYLGLHDGDRFDLGGQVLEAIALPGHSKGSMCFYNKGERYALTGDAITRFPILCVPRCPPIAQYHAALLRFRELLVPGTRLYCGHSLHALPPELLNDLIAGCGEIMKGSSGDDPDYRVYIPEFSGIKAKSHSHGCCVIHYNPKNIE